MIDLTKLSKDAEEASLAASTVDELAKVQNQFLGKKSELVAAKKALGSIPENERATAGKEINATRVNIESILDQRRVGIEEAEWETHFASDVTDLTEVLNPITRGHLHLITQARDQLEDVFVGMGFTVAEGPEVETAWYNFEALNIPDWHPARGNFDTIFVDLGEDEEVMLRSHTSPVQIRTMEEQRPPIYIVAPGRTFRTDSADATHLPAFNQIEGLVIDKGITMGDLAGTIDSFVQAFFGEEVKSRLRPSYFPFTEPSAEFDISRPDGSWLELGGCGMVHPNVLENCGIDPEEWQGFAFGFGIDRLVSMRYQLDDIRELVLNDARFLRQF
ncbi:MAG TPA: phenylalanine--tRNA ligase subunit alpha [Acidimicrobiales bacterium]|jgi:phenylalanyl-tRNA synthetase alpha chain|nr:phenylalanine--tRNA ligase subunit alpha [Acidimicrobiales bacterium]|tara:strand:+ start:4149 stop:5144 length:996 start_codon:yes stop_codon:yes gene_type:complete